MSEMIPVFVSFNGKKITVFGGGPVAVRKCRYFEGARIKVVAEETVREMDSLATSIIRMKVSEESVEEMMDDADLIIAATGNRELNEKIRDIAISKNMPVNSSHGGGTVLIPSVLRRRGYDVAVSSRGLLPAFPPYLVEELDIFLNERFDLMFDLLYALRSRISGMGTQKERSELLHKVAHDPSIRDALSEGDVQKARDVVERMVDL